MTEMSLIRGNEGEEESPIHTKGDWLRESKIEFLAQGIINTQQCMWSGKCIKKECVKHLK